MPSKKFEIPDMELYCDMKPPYKCNECGSVLEFDENEAQYEHDEGRYDGEV